MISIETLGDDFDAPSNPPLTDPLGPDLLRLNLDGYTLVYTYVHFSVIYPMAEFEKSLPYAYPINIHAFRGPFLSGDTYPRGPTSIYQSCWPATFLCWGEPFSSPSSA